VPLAGDGVTEGVQPSLRVATGGVGIGKDHARGTHGHRDQAGLHDPCAHATGGLVACSAHHGQPRGEAGGLGHLRRDVAGDLGRFHAGRHPLYGDIELGQDLLAPAAPAHVEEYGARGVGYLGGVLARQAIADIVLGQQHLRHPSVHLRLVVTGPYDLGSGEPGERGVHGQLQEALAPHPLHYPAALVGGALVVPHDAWAQHLPLIVEKHHAVHLAGEADTRQFSAVDAARLEHLADRRNRSLPPVLRLLLGPEGAWGVHGILEGGATDHAPLGVDQQRLGAGGTDVDADQECHVGPPMGI